MRGQLKYLTTILIASCIILTACYNTQQAKQPDISQDTLITDKSIGQVSLGESIEKLMHDTKTPYHIKKEKFVIEGESESVYNAYNESGQKLFALEPDEKDLTKIFRITIYHSKFKTLEGIAVGSTLGELKSKYKIEFISTEGESGLEVAIKGRSICFILENSFLPKDWWDTLDTKNIPDNIPVREIILN